LLHNWKTYVDRPETEQIRAMAMNLLGNGLISANHPDAVTVKETELSTLRRLGAPEHHILVVQSNLANTYDMLGQRDRALSIEQEVYSGRLKLNGNSHEETLRAANNYATALFDLQRFKEGRKLLRKTIPLARRALGEEHRLTLKMRSTYAMAFCRDDDATLDNLREALTTLEEMERTVRRVLGGAHPFTVQVESFLRLSRAALAARETPSRSK